MDEEDAKYCQKIHTSRIDDQSFPLSRNHLSTMQSDKITPLRIKLPFVGIL